ncbi:MAG TPA: ATP-binding protein [Candidatus Eisenbacteria bacterium]|nr:ATP-binding protein [Candidatus Eisenbacteria bacterium]
MTRPHPADLPHPDPARGSPHGPTADAPLSDRLLATAQHVAQLGTWEWDVASDVVTWSDALRRIYGVPPGHCPSRAGYLALVHPDDRALVSEVTSRALRDHAPFDYEVRIVRPDGGLRVLRTTGEVALDDRGEPARMFGTGQDVTERKYLEVRLRMAEKLEAVGRLAGGVAHDFNNLLTAVLGHAEQLVAGLPEGHPLRHHALQVRRAAEQAAMVTRQLLAFARKQMLEPRALDLNVVLEGMHDVLQRLLGGSIELVTIPAARLGRVHADPGQIEQVVLDLVLRARDALPEGGRITLSVEDADLDPESAMRFAPATPGSYVLLTVTDNGEGMTPDERARIFEPFFGARPGEHGTGLTLASVYGIVKQSGGTIWVESAPGRGSTFRVFLPRLAGTNGDSPAHDPEPRGTVLLVEDEPAVRSLLRGVLSRAGYSVIAAADADEALAAAAAHAGEIDLLITDVVMAGMGGRELASKLGAERPGIRVLFVSGYHAEAIGLDDPPAADFLGKPFTPAALEAKVREILGRGEPIPG